VASSHQQRTASPICNKALYATLDVVWEKNEVNALYRLEFVMMPNTGVGRGVDVLIIGDDSCGVLLLRARMISPTRLSRGMGYAGNMPKRNIYFEFLHGGDTMETKSYR
jgi:hypothetical protein